jgi:hypothetical protein
VDSSGPANAGPINVNPRRTIPTSPRIIGPAPGEILQVEARADSPCSRAQVAAPLASDPHKSRGVSTGPGRGPKATTALHVIHLELGQVHTSTVSKVAVIPAPASERGGVYPILTNRHRRQTRRRRHRPAKRARCCGKRALEDGAQAPAGVGADGHEQRRQQALCVIPTSYARHSTCNTDAQNRIGGSPRAAPTLQHASSISCGQKESSCHLRG